MNDSQENKGYAKRVLRLCRKDVWPWVHVVISVVGIWAGLFIYTKQSNRQIAITEMQYRPHIDIWYSEDNTGAGFKLWSNGLGPALVKTFKVFVKKGETEDDWEEARDWSDVFKNLGVERAPHPFVAEKYAGSSYPPGEPIEIFWQKKGYWLHILREKHDLIAFSYCYCSFYLACWSGNSNKIFLKKEDACKEAGEGFDRIIFATTVISE